MWYGFVSGDTICVTQDYKEIDILSSLLPYPKFRKFPGDDGEDRAWEFVNHYRKKKAFESVRDYGDCFDGFTLKVNYIIDKDCVYYNVRTGSMGFVSIACSDENVEMTVGNSLITIKLNNISLNNNLISSHAIAIWHILRILGDLVDINLTVPDHSVFYLLTSYTGNKPSLVRVLDKIKSRKGHISLTVERW